MNLHSLSFQKPTSGVVSALLLVGTLSSVAQERTALLADAVAAWHMDGTNDGAGKNSSLTVQGSVTLGVSLENPERAGSIARYGDGKVAVFQGGYLSAGQGAEGELSIQGRRVTIALRLRDPSGKWSYPIFSKYGGHSELVYNVFATALEGQAVVGTEIGTTRNNTVLQALCPVATFDPRAWHDVAVRCNGAKLELFVDGRCVDEDFMLGDFRSGNRFPVLVGAQAVGNGHVEQGFTGLVDHIFLWKRALTDQEIRALAGAHEAPVNKNRERTDSGLVRESMQYWRPPNQYYVGDCMPFFHDGLFHFVYLLDRRHHAAKNGLGAHQWAQATSRDLSHWEHQPLMLAIDEQWEGSICTGSTLFHHGSYYAAYATRASGLRFPAGYQYFNVATSQDGVRFQKAQPNPLNAPPGGFAPEDWRDPFLRNDLGDGLFHVLLSARDLKQGGCLSHLVSRDMKEFEYRDPLLYTRDFPGTGAVPECPDWFAWGDWQYLIYNGCYLVSKTAFGPWRLPDNYKLDGSVMKTAPFSGNRRIGTAWISHLGFANRAIFREAVQRADGALSWKFVEEMKPQAGERLDETATLKGAGETRAQLPGNSCITLTIKPGQTKGPCGLRIREADDSPGLELRIDPAEGWIQLGTVRKKLLPAPSGAHRLEIYVQDEITDLCIDNSETLIVCERPRTGTQLVLWSRNSDSEIRGLELRPLTKRD